MSEGPANLGARIKSGVFWNLVGQYTGKVLAISAMVILARELTTADFGIYGMSVAVWALIQTLGQAGIGQKLIQTQDDIDAHANASFYMNLIVGVLLASLAAGIAPLAAAFYDTEILQLILTLYGISFLVEMLGATHINLLRKDLRFKAINAVDILESIAVNGAQVVLALEGFGVWSFVIPQVSAAPFRVLLYWILHPWRPRFHLELAYWRGIFDYGRWILGSNVLRELNVNGDYLIMGRMLGQDALGLYRFAFELANWPVQNMVRSLQRVTFPALTTLQHDLPAMGALYLKMVRVISLSAFPVFLGLIATADHFVPFVYSEKWIPAILPLKIIVVFTLIRAVASPSGQILRATGVPHKEFWFNLAQLPVLLTAVFVGTRYGIVGVATAVACVLGPFALIFLHITTRQVGLGLPVVLGQAFPAAVSAGLMWGCVHFAIGELETADLRVPVLLLCAVAIGVASYAAALFLFFRSEAQMLVRLALDLVGRRTTA